MYWCRFEGYTVLDLNVKRIVFILRLALRKTWKLKMKQQLADLNVGVGYRSCCPFCVLLTICWLPLVGWGSCHTCRPSAAAAAKSLQSCPTLCHLSSPKTGRDSLHFVDAEMKQSSRQVENETDEKVLEARGTVFQGGCVRRDRLCKRLQINHFIWKLAGLRNGNAVVILTGAVTYWRHGAESLVGVESRENGRSSCQEASTDTPF